MDKQQILNGALILIHTLNFNFTQCYLIPCANGYLQIDTAFPGQYAAYRRKLRRLGINIDQIRWLLLTHHHIDHVGFAAALIRDSSAGLVAHHLGKTFIENGQISDQIHPINPTFGIFYSLLTGVTNHRQVVFPPIRLPRNCIFIKNETLLIPPDFGIAGRIIHTPGHTSDSISLILADGTVFCGDALMNNPMFQLLGARYRPFILENETSVLQSWEKLIINGAVHIYPAHGKPITATQLALTRSALLT